MGIRLKTYSFDEIVETLAELELNLGFSLEKKYTEMLDKIKINKPITAEEYPNTFEDLVELNDRDRLLDLMVYLGIDIGKRFPYSADLTIAFYNTLHEITGKEEMVD